MSSDDYFHNDDKDDYHTITLFFVFLIVFIANTVISIYCCRMALYIYYSEQAIRNPDAGIINNVHFVNDYQQQDDLEMEIAGEV